MDWNKTKTIFILTFFILNIFLSLKLIERNNENQLDVISKTSIEELLSEMNITYPKLPEIKATETHISGVNTSFKDAELQRLTKQNYTVTEAGRLISLFENKIPITNPDKIIEELDLFIKEHLIKGEEYRFWKYDEQTNGYYYIQTFAGKPIYYNQRAMLIIYLTNEQEIMGYAQNYLTIQMKEVKQDILSPIKVLEVLLDKQYLQYEGKVDKIELGYFNLPEIAGDVQVLAPTWHVIIGENHYFVDAIDGELLKIGQNWSGENGITF